MRSDQLSEELRYLMMHNREQELSDGTVTAFNQVVGIWWMLIKGMTIFWFVVGCPR